MFVHWSIGSRHERETIRNLRKTELKYIPKIVLIQKFSRDIHFVWHRLPNHLKFDPEILSHRLCYEHYNLPNERTHIDGPAPMIKDCTRCIIAEIESAKDGEEEEEEKDC